MSMNGIDYTKRLAKEREYFQDANKRVQDAAQKRIDETEKKAEYITKKQKENFIEDRAELESSYQTNLNHLKEKSQASRVNSTQKFSDEINRKREIFNQESTKKREEFDQRLREVKSSYDKNFESQQERNEELGKLTKERHDKSLGDLRNDFQAKIQEYEDNLRRNGAAESAQNDKERKQLVKTQEEREAKLQKESADQMDSLKSRIRYDNKMKDLAQEAELNHQRSYFKDRLGEEREKFETRKDALSTDYSDKNEKMVEDQHRQTVKTNREHQEQISELRRDYNKSLRKIEVEKRRQDNGSGEFAEVQKRQRGLNDKFINENKIKNLQNKLVHAQREYQSRGQEDQDRFNLFLKKQSAEATAREEKKLNEASADKILTVSKEREKAQQEIEDREHQSVIAKQNHEAQIMNERKTANDRLSRLKENFNESMKSYEEKHKDSLEQVTKSANADKKEFIKNFEENRVQEIIEMKRAFEKMLNSTANEYEQRIASYQRDNQLLKVTMDQKIKTIVDKAQNEMESQRTLFEDRHEEDLRNQRMILEDKENQLKQSITDLNTQYQKKIDKMQIEGETKLKLITDDYETKLRTLKAESKKEMLSKENAHRNELMQIKKAYEDEKLRLANSYESQIESLEKRNRDQVNQLGQFKRLS